jgi:hypothetical protein
MPTGHANVVGAVTLLRATVRYRNLRRQRPKRPEAAALQSLTVMSAIVAAPLATPMADCSVGRFGHGGVATEELPRGAVRPRDDRTVTPCEAGEPFISVRQHVP